MRAAWVGTVLLASIATMPSAARVPAAPDTLDAFEQLLAREDSATAALAQWCRARGIASDPVITARPLGEDAAATPAWVRERLGVDGATPVASRHVALTCGEVVLSDARNWYLPSRLPTAMQDDLAHGDRPFGAVIAPLGFTRERLASVRGAGEGCPGATVLTNRALIRLRSGEPLALVIECYQPGVLGR